MASGELGRQNIHRALAGFASALAIDRGLFPEQVQDVVESGCIQKFEYCAELFWKYVRSRLIEEGSDVANSPRAVIKAALSRGWVRDDEYGAALAIFDDRNRCSHVYRESMIPEILGRLPGHLAVMQQVTDRCVR